MSADWSINESDRIRRDNDAKRKDILRVQIPDIPKDYNEKRVANPGQGNEHEWPDEDDLIGPMNDDGEQPNKDNNQKKDERRPTNDGGRPNDERRRPTNDGGKPNDERRPSNDERRPTNDERRPTNDGRRPTNDGRRPTNDGRKPNDEQRPNDESDNNEANNEDNSSLESDDETLSERLLGLTEMFPEPVTEVIDQMADFLHTHFKKVYWFSRQSTWIVETCTLILLGPILLSYCGWKRDAAMDPGPCGSGSSCGAMIGHGARKCHLSRPRP